MSVPLLDLTAQWQAIKPEVMPLVERVLDSQMVINGPACRDLEKAVAAYCGVKHGVSLSSGTDALIVALQAMNIGCGDEVITSPYTFFATAGSLWRQGVRPVFVDIDPATYNLNPDQLASKVNPRTKAIMPVHLFGCCAEMDPINDLARKHGLRIIEDGAQAIGATYQGKKVGQLGHVAALSFYPTKNLGGAGDGGMCVTDDDALAERMNLFRNHGARERYYHDEVGGNFRMDTLNAAYLLVKLRRLDSWHEARRVNAARYNDLLADIDELTTPYIPGHCGSIYNQYVVRTPRRDALQKHLTDHGIGTAIYYPLSLHQQTCFASLGYKSGDFPQSERAAQETLALPVFPEMEEVQQLYVVDAIKSFFAS